MRYLIQHSNFIEPESLKRDREGRSKSVIDALNRSFANENSHTTQHFVEQTAVIPNASLTNVFLATKDEHGSRLNPDGLVLVQKDGRSGNGHDVNPGNR